MEKLLTAHSVENFITPDPILQTNPILQGVFPEGENHTILHYINKDNPLGIAPTNPSDDAQYNSWEFGVQQWLKLNPQIIPTTN